QRTQALVAHLQARGVTAPPAVATEFVAGMVSLVASSAGISEDAARSIIPATATTQWADSLTHDLAPHPNGSVLVPASTVASALAALGLAAFETDPPAPPKAAVVTRTLGRTVLAMPGHDVVPLPSQLYRDLCDVLDDLRFGRTPAGDGAVLDMADKSLHELDLVAP